MEGDPPVESAVGTTVRFYDAEEDAWTSLWVAPRYGLLMRFAVHETGGEIVLESRDEDGQLDHWIFSDVTPAAFRWRAEESHDDGKTWKRTEEMRIHRRSDER